MGDIIKETFPVNQLMPFIYSKMNKEGRIRLNQDWVRVGSSRMKTFALKGIKCASCGIEGSFFRKELDKHSIRDIYHLNLYAISLHGKFILMTKDHIIPLCRGGKGTLDNLQTMCQPCNNNIKGNK